MSRPALHQPLTGFPPWLIVAGVLTAVGPLSIDMYLPSFPSIVADLHTDAGAVQRTLAMFFVGLALGQLLYGPLSDRFGRKPPLYVGFALYAGASAFCAFAPNIHALQWGRFVQALGGCAGMVITRALIRDRCDPRGTARAMSMIILVMGLAPILAPQLGVLILRWFDWRIVFGLLTLFGLVSLLVIRFGIDETLDRRTTPRLQFSTIRCNYGALLRDRHFLAFSLCGGLGSAGMFAYIAGSPFVFMALHGVSTTTYGWIFGANAFGLIAASQINARLLAYHPPEKILACSVYVPALLGLLLLMLKLFGAVTLPMLLPILFFGISSLGFSTPNSAALALQHQGTRAGAASALMGALQLSLATLSSTAISAWVTQDELPLASMLAACWCGALVLFRIARRSAP